MRDGTKLRVGDVAKMTGKTVRAIHLYEELGLLRPLERSPGGFRIFAPDAVDRVAWINKLQTMGFSLAQVQEFAKSLERSQTAPLAMLKVRGMFEEKLRDTRSQIARLRALESDLEQGLAYLEGCHWCDPAELPENCTACAKHDEVPPPIIKGMHRS